MTTKSYLDRLLDERIEIVKGMSECTTDEACYPIALDTLERIQKLIGKETWRQRVTRFIFIAQLSILVACLMFLFTGCSSVPQSTVGTWKASNFSATVTEGNIEISIVGEDGSEMLYWDGTFVANTTGTVRSIADQDALRKSLVGSQDATKDFVIAPNGKTITFKMSMMGVKRTIEMERAA